MIHFGQLHKFQGQPSEVFIAKIYTQGDKDINDHLEDSGWDYILFGMYIDFIPVPNFQAIFF